jgi:multidrug efflux system membrane fusion protein
VEAAAAALETANLNLEYCYIHSPIDGRAGARLVDVGNVVTANTTSLLSIQRLDPIYAIFTITEGDLPAVQKQMSSGMLKATVRLPSDPENIARTGRVEFLDNAVQNGSGTVNLRATMSNPDRHFWPGQFVDVKLILSTEKGAVLIPNQATEISQRGPFVYVVKSDDTAELRPVKLGQRQGDQVVVTDGLAPNERVVLAGQMLVRPGGKVRVENSQPATSNASGNTPAAGGQS